MSSLKYALRMLFKAPFVTSVAIASLAFGIGANSAIFSLFDQMLLRPLPVHEPERLVSLGSPGPKPGSQSCGQAGDCDVVFSYPMFLDLARQQQVFAGIAAHVSFGVNLAYQGQTVSGQGMLVSGSYFPVLGLQPTIGRLLQPGDDSAPGESHVVVLGYTYWRDRFSASDAVLNQQLIVNGIPMTIVGVAPRGFDGTTLGIRPYVYAPITMRGFTQLSKPSFEDRRWYWAYLFARLKPDVSIEHARSALNLQYHAIINDVEAPLQKGMSDATLTKFKAKTITVEEGSRGQSSVHTNSKEPLTLLLYVTGLVLLIACANIANLLLVRSTARAGEMAVRLSIGANRGQLVGQLLLESLLLAVFGGLAGIVVARWTLVSIQAALPANAAQTIGVRIDSTMVIFAAALSAATGVLFGLFPALHSTRPDLTTTLKGQAGQPSGARAAKRFRMSIATTQIALSMALLVAAGLFIKSLAKISRVDLGLKTENVVTFRISPALNGYTPERARAFFERAEETLAATPGVTAVGASSVPLIAGSNWGNDVTVQGFPTGPDVDNNSRYNLVGPGYFRTLGIPLLSGREFARSDAFGAPKVAIVNETFAKKFKLGREAVGKLMARNTGDDVKLDIEIVGLVQDSKYSDVKRAIPPVFFIPFSQDNNVGRMSFLVKTSLDPESFLPTVPRVIATLDPNLPVEDLRTLPQQVRENVFLDRLISILSASFAGLATLLAAIGLYGVLAYTVAQRTREFGLRMALGADPGRVRRMVLRQVGWMTLIGGAVGLAGAIGLGNLAKSLLFELQGHDPAVLAGAAVVLTIVALGAGLIPALRASRIEPMKALRYE